MPSDAIQPFLAYASAFEVSYAADDWSAVDSSVTDDVVWVVHGAPRPVGGVAEGRETVLATIKRSCDAFDRRFDVREPKILEGPTPIPGGVHFTWVVSYRREGLPSFELRGEEWDFFRDGKLEFHREKLHNVPEGLAFIARHGDALVPQRGARS